MTKIYIVKECYYDYCDIHYTYLEAFLNKDDAELYKINLDEKFGSRRKDHHWFSVETFDLKTFDGATLKYIEN